MKLPKNPLTDKISAAFSQSETEKPLKLKAKTKPQTAGVDDAGLDNANIDNVDIDSADVDHKAAPTSKSIRAAAGQVEEAIGIAQSAAKTTTAQPNSHPDSPQDSHQDDATGQPAPPSQYKVDVSARVNRLTNKASNVAKDKVNHERQADTDNADTTDNTNEAPNKGLDSQSNLFASLFERAQSIRKSKRNAMQADNADQGSKHSSSTASISATKASKNSPVSGDADLTLPAHKLRLVFLGGGSFGTAMSNLAARNGCDSTLWVRNKRTVRALKKNRINKKYLPNFTLSDQLKYEHDLKTAIQNKDIIFVAVPSAAFRETLQKIAPFITGQAVVSLTKGMEKNTFALMSDIITEELPEVNFGVMSGPNLAVEIMQNMPSAAVIASESPLLRHAVQSALHSTFFRVFAADDIRGVELGGALKNIYAIAMGMAAAYNVGENTKALLLTRALAEMSRFGAAAGANPLTFLGLSGVGDLYATCNSELSRNYRIGNMLGKGMSLEAAIKKLGQTAEGVNTIQQVHDKAVQAGVYMPITHALHAAIFEGEAALGVALNLMETGFRSDVEFVMAHEYSNEALNEQLSETLDDNTAGTTKSVNH